jgi:hypothetical protein
MIETESFRRKLQRAAALVQSLTITCTAMRNTSLDLPTLVLVTAAISTIAVVAQPILQQLVYIHSHIYTRSASTSYVVLQAMTCRI